MRFLAVSSIVAAVMLATPARAAMVRHLEYAVTIYPTKTAAAPIRNADGPGTATVDIDVLGSAKDGGTVVAATQTTWNAVRSRQTVRCEVYERGDVLCGAEEFPSAGEAVLLPLLAPGIIPVSRGTFAVFASAVTGAGIERGQRQYTTSAVADPHDASRVDLTILRNVRSAGTIEEEHVSYDRSQSAALFVHDVTRPPNALYSTSIDATLVGS